MNQNRLKVIYLINAPAQYFRSRFIDACEAHDISYEYMHLADCMFHILGQKTTLYHKNTIVDPAEGYFFIRVKGEDCYFCYLLCEFLDQAEAQFNDPINRMHTMGEGKISQLLRLAPQGIPFPESFICRRYSMLAHKELILKRLGFPCVVKRSGSRGEAVWLINSESELLEKFNERPYEAHIIQKYVPNTHDLRVIVFEGQIIGAMTRSSADGFANTAYDAVLEKTELSDAERDLAVDAAEKGRVDLVGVDIVRTDEGLMIWEINKTPQLDRFIPATGIDAVHEVIGHLKRKYF